MMQPPVATGYIESNGNESIENYHSNGKGGAVLSDRSHRQSNQKASAANKTGTGKDDFKGAYLKVSWNLVSNYIVV